jgi:formamidase
VSAEIDVALERLRVALDASRITLRRADLVEVFPVRHEALGPGVGSIREVTGLDMTRQPVVQQLLAGAIQVVEHDCASASDDAGYHDMRARFGGLAAQIVTPVRRGDELVAILSIHDLRAPRQWTESELATAREAAASILDHRLAPPVRRPLIEAPDTGHNRWHPDLEPAITVEPGDTITVDCRDGLDGQIVAATTDADLLTLSLGRGHPLTGPIAVRGARPGDVLRVDILDVICDSFGSTALIPGFGLLADRFPDPYLVTWGLYDGVATSGRMPGVRVPADPFVGVIGVAPSHARLAEWTAREAACGALPPLADGAVPATEPYASTAVRTIPPRELGGNLDVRQVRAGSTIFFVVDVDGALLSLGDVHFAQGDGEVCGTAIECHGRVRLRVDLVRGASHVPQTPLIEAAEPAIAGGRRHVVTTGFPLRGDGSVSPMDATLAARNALLAMIDWLGAERGLTPQQAYILCSAAGDLRISQIVDVPHPTVSALCPLDLFHDVPPRRDD